MFRVANRLRLTLSPNLNTFFCNCHTSTKLSPLLQIKEGDKLARKGEIRKSEAIYKQVIRDNPKYELGYQRLWESWVSTRSLKIPESELNDFMKKYEENITKQQTNSSSLKIK